MERFPLLEEYRLIERSESEVNGAWKGAHILLFFLAFVFGSFCTFCFHMLMYLFDEKCVLFPKLLSMTALRHNIIYEFLPADKDITDNLPVDFLSTQWVDQSACYLPTYVPLVSGIFGLVWTTMFLMCSSGSRTHTGLQRPWRVLPPVFIFSLVMAVICIYATLTTHNGLEELCAKLGEITGSFSCTYTINVATLAYERRIRGVYQATQLTIVSAWLHTMCWLCSALLTLVRVLLAVDFQLIRVRVELRCDIDKMLEQHEKQVHTVSPEVWFNSETETDNSVTTGLKDHSTTIYFKNKTYDAESDADVKVPQSESDILYFADQPEGLSELSLVPAERSKLARLTACKAVSKQNQFIVKIVYDLVDSIILVEVPSKEFASQMSNADKVEKENQSTAKKYAHNKIRAKKMKRSKAKSLKKYVSVKRREAEETAKEIRRTLQEKINKQKLELAANKELIQESEPESSRNITLNINKDLEDDSKSSDKPTDTKPNAAKKSNLKNTGIQTDTSNKKKDAYQKVQISESIHSRDNKPDSPHSSEESVQDEETQTRHKEKQD